MHPVKYKAGEHHVQHAVYHHGEVIAEEAQHEEQYVGKDSKLSHLKAGLLCYVHCQHVKASYGAAAGNHHSVAHAHAYAADYDAGQPVVDNGGGGHRYESGSQGEYRGKDEGAQEEPAAKALVGDYEYGYADYIVQNTRKVNMVERYIEILSQHRSE